MSLTKTEPQTMINAMSLAAKYIKLEKDQRLEMREKTKSIKNDKIVL